MTDTINEMKAVIPFHTAGKIFRKKSSPRIESNRQFLTDFAWKPFVRVRREQKAIKKAITVAESEIKKPISSNGTNATIEVIRRSNAYLSHGALLRGTYPFCTHISTNESICITRLTLLSLFSVIALQKS